VAPSRMVGVSASVNLPLQHKVQKFSSGTGSPGWSQKRAVRWLWWWFQTIITAQMMSVGGEGINKSRNNRTKCPLLLLQAHTLSHMNSHMHTHACTHTHAKMHLVLCRAFSGQFAVLRCSVRSRLVTRSFSLAISSAGLCCVAGDGRVIFASV